MRSYNSSRIPSFCNAVGISAAWIDSTGVVFDLPKMARERAEAGEDFIPEDHEEWAHLFLGSQSAPPDEMGEEESDSTERLVQAGWIKVSNATSIDASNPTDASKYAFAKMLAQCVGDGHIDPFEEIYIWTGDGSWTPESANLVEEWGGKDISEAMFAKLNAKLREARTLRTLRGLVRALLS